jgi:hypothetical protein
VIYRFDATDGQLGRVGQVDDLYEPRNLALHGAHAYVADLQGLRVIDMSDSAHPSELSRYQSDGPIQDVVVSGTSAFLVVRTSFPTSGLRVVDISNPSAITEVSRYELGLESDGPLHVVVEGEYAFLYWNGPMLGDYYLDIIEIATMHRMARLGILLTDVIAVRGQYLLASGVWDISDITEPKYLGYGRLVPRAGGGTSTPESYVYLSGSSGLFILDLRGIHRTQESLITPSTWGHIKSRFK